MARVQIDVTVGATPVRPVSVSTLAAKVTVQMKEGGTGRGFIGGSNLGNAGENAWVSLAAASATAPGAFWSEENQSNCNTIDVSTYRLHGTVPGDVIRFTYAQN